ncbi:phosphatase PAP2 family protein [Halonotius terrestris]|nr:phosphatase PAP2 family protein [Halonotius terrestris]
MVTATPLLTPTELLVTVFAFITLGGDVGVLFVGLSLGYWFGPRLDETTRPAAATTIAVAMLALAVVLAVKSYTAIPRPAAMPIDPTVLPGGLADFVGGELDSDGFSFPSGHATGSTAVYGSLAVLLTVGRRRLRYLVAGVAIGLISLSRVVIGVHYPRDIIAGMLLGTLLVAGGVKLARDGDRLRPDRVFVLAGVAASIGAVVAWQGGHTEEVRQGVIGIGTTLGALGVWHRVGERLTDAPAVSLPVALAGIVVAGALWIGAYEGVFGLVGTVVGSAVGVTIILWLPLVESWRRKKRDNQ